MSLVLSSMIDCDFAWTTAPGAAHDLVVVQGGVTYNIDVPTGTYRLFLAQSSKNFLAVLNAAVTATGAAGYFELVWEPEPLLGVTTEVGAHVVWQSVGVASTNTYSTDLSALLGGLTSGVPATQMYSTYAPRHAVFLGDVHGGGWKPTRPGGFERTHAGRVYGFVAGNTSHEREFTSGFIPSDAPSMLTLPGYCPATPWWPAHAYISAINPSSATIRQWSWLDFLAQAVNAECGFACGNLATLLAEQPAGAYVAEFYQGYLDGQTLTDPQVAKQFASWEAYEELRWRFVLPTTAAVDTRA